MARQSTIRHRIFSDFLIGSRLDAYEGLLRVALDRGYRFAAVRELADGAIVGSRYDRWCVLRHDVDTDPDTAEAMWRIESALGVPSTFFFRLSTARGSLMQEMHEAGIEVGYHYEEIASIVKKQGLRQAADVSAHMAQARASFLRNLEWMRGRSSVAIEAAASHGDFANRVIGMTNTPILEDDDFRDLAGITYEAYDEGLNSPITSRFSDSVGPSFWVDEPPHQALRRGDPVVYLLVHPRHWRANLRVNLVDDINRAVEAIAYSARTWRRKRS